MCPTQRNLMKKSILLLSLLFSTTFPVVAGQDVDLVANIKSNTCQSGISNKGNIDLGVVGVGDFAGNISADNYHPGGKEFTITVQDCTLQGTGNVLNQLHIDFRSLSGVMATGSSQIFPNENEAGAKNIGIVIFSVENMADRFNVLDSSGNSRSVYPVMSTDINGSTWKFSTRMQKIDSTQNITSGQVMSHVLVDIYYE